MKNLMSISEFSKISDVSRKALIYYDHIGLFKPVYRANNGYRYYSHQQIETITVINTLSACKMKLEDIKEYLDNCDPQIALNILNIQKDKIKEQIEELQSIDEMLTMRTALIEETLKENNDIKIVDYEDIPLYISPAFHHDTLNIPEDIFINFFNSFKEKHIAFGYPPCYIIDKDDIVNHNYQMISWIAIRINKNKANHYIPKGKYIVGYGYGRYGHTKDIYSKIYQYINENHITIIGHAYEEYILDELTTHDQYKIKVSIQIRG